MTPKERAEDLVRRFDEPVMDKTNYRVQAMISMTEQAIIAAIEEEQCAIAYRLGEMTAEAASALERAAYMRVAAFIDARSDKPDGG